MGMMFLNIRRVDVGSKNYANIVNYYGRDEAVEVKEEDAIAIDDVLENPEAIINYYGRFEEDDGYPGFDFQGGKTNEQALYELETLQPKEIYQSVISFKSEDATKLGLVTKQDFMTLANSYILSCAKQLDIKRENLVWSGYVHSNTENPHMHIYFFDKSRIEQPLFKKREILKVRSSLANTIINQVDSYKEKDQNYKRVIEEAKMMFSDKKIDDLIGSRTVLGHHKLISLSDGDKALLRAFKDLSLSIPLDGRKSALSLEKWHPDVYKQLEGTREMMVEELKSMSIYKNSLNEITEAFVSVYGSESKGKEYYNNQMDKINRRLDNEIVKFVTEHRNELLHPDFDFNDVPLNFAGSFNKLQSSVNKQFMLGIQGFLFAMKPRKEKEKEREREYEEEIDY